MKKHTFFFCAILFFTYSGLPAQSVTGRIHLNQVGFYPYAPKIAVIAGAIPDSVFFIRGISSGDTVFKSTLSGNIQSAYSSTVTRKADFSALHQTGDFEVLLPSIGKSYPFSIQPNNFHLVGKAVTKAFYFQRMSMPLEEKYAGPWHHAAGHPDTAVVIHPSAADPRRPGGTRIAVPGGWYDAGDYNKYIVNSGITMGTLLSAYEDFPAYFDSLSLDIPESNNGCPDLLDEIVYNLRWMLTMQDPADGGVYHKCTNANFDKMIMPEEAGTVRYVVQKGTAATLDFAAVTAQASRILVKFSKQFPGLGDSCSRAAVMAWQWVEKNPAIEYDQAAINSQYDPDITTGAYGDKKFSDEHFWAAAELSITRKEKKYLQALSTHLNDSLSVPSWNNVYMLGYYSLLRHKSILSAKELKQLQDKLIRYADSFIANGGNAAFGTIMGQSRRDFVWGSSAVAANQGILLINAYLAGNNEKYLSYALTNLDYLLGRNATGYCFVTGTGSKAPMHPHHRQSIADGILLPVPGLLSGGPNPGRQDKCNYEFTEPETAFTDNDCSYASNEIAINWNAPMVYLVNALEVLQKKAGYIKE